MEEQRRKDDQKTNFQLYILSGFPLIEWHVRFTPVLLKFLSDQECRRYQ